MISKTKEAEEEEDEEEEKVARASVVYMCAAV